MNIIQKHLSDLTPTAARSVCYYLSRHIKQAAIFDDYSKDMFAEGQFSEPDEEVIARTRQLVSEIENIEGVTADKFDDPTYQKWMKNILEYEKNLSTHSEPTLRVENFLKFGST